MWYDYNYFNKKDSLLNFVLCVYLFMCIFKTLLYNTCIYNLYH